MNKTFSTFIILGLLSGCGSGSSSPTAALPPATGPCSASPCIPPLHQGPISPLHRGQSYPHNGELIPPPTTFHHPGPPPSLI